MLHLTLVMFFFLKKVCIGPRTSDRNVYSGRIGATLW